MAKCYTTVLPCQSTMEHTDSKYSRTHNIYTMCAHSVSFSPLYSWFMTTNKIIVASKFQGIYSFYCNNGCFFLLSTAKWIVCVLCAWMANVWEMLILLFELWMRLPRVDESLFSWSHESQQNLHMKNKEIWYFFVVFAVYLLYRHCQVWIVSIICFD